MLDNPLEGTPGILKRELFSRGNYLRLDGTAKYCNEKGTPKEGTLTGAAPIVYYKPVPDS